MTPITKEGIKDKAEMIANSFNSKKVSPFPFSDVQDSEKNLKIVGTKELPDNVFGVFGYSEEEKTYYILINENQGLEKQEFAKAHELGHYFLHKNGACGNTSELPIVDYNKYKRIMFYQDGCCCVDKATEIREAEANYFAVSLLLPKKLVKEVWEKLHDVDDCAAVFNVPVPEMALRLEELDLV